MTRPLHLRVHERNGGAKAPYAQLYFTFALVVRLRRVEHVDTILKSNFNDFLIE